MKNLQSFGVQELSAKEVKEIDGGLLLTCIAIGGFWLASFTVGWMIGTALGEKSRRESGNC
jgi:lactobin A/cerein 7B family class IIb bacteriocin